MIMKLKILAIGIVLIAACLSGCIVKDDVSGTYRCAVDNGVLDLLEDERYEMLIDEAHGGGGSFGEYSIRDGAVRLKMEFLGVLVPFDIDGRDLIDPDGDRWVRD